MRGFSINIQGRLKNFHLPKNQPLIPLFEAIVNSIHAIGERRQSGEKFTGKIIIRIIREAQTVMAGSGELPPIVSFKIVDNGVGFNEPNLESFMESDSTYKEALGGKGVGRFSWLVAFQKAEIESIYCEEAGYVRRAFEFSPQESEINDSLEDCVDQEDNKTTVKLLNCMTPYSDNIPKKAQTIAMRIIQHCLIYFISPDCPDIILEDDEESLNLNSIFKKKIKTEDNHITIHIGNEIIDLLHVKVEEASVNGNKLYLCANNRLVETKELEKYITDLDREIFDRCGFWYVGVLSSQYLDKAVNTARTAFDIPNGGPLNSTANMITMDQIMKGAVSKIKLFLQDYLMPISSSKIKRIQNYVTYQAPQFRHLLKYMETDIMEIKPNLSDDKLDDELHRIKRRFDRRTKDENRKILKELKEGTISTPDYIHRFRSQVEKINSANSAVLAEYIAHRKIILDLMEFAIRKKEDGGFQKESFLHNLIYPMRATSDDTPYNSHNLWLIDEKLAYCDYISSDIPFDNDPSQGRTDIMILDQPVALSEEENTGREYETIILFELKRPMRNDYTDGDNPITQLYGYVKKLKSGTARDKNGRPIKVGGNTQFYLYAVCDITSSLLPILEFYDFTQTPDSMGYYRYNDKLNAYIEILSYDKIVNDANKRNRILFDKLGI